MRLHEFNLFFEKVGREVPKYIKKASKRSLLVDRISRRISDRSLLRRSLARFGEDIDHDKYLKKITRER